MNTETFTSLKVLRMWHWRQMQEYLARAASKTRHADSISTDNRVDAIWKQKCRDEAADLQQCADLHLSAVQVLNECVPSSLLDDINEEGKA